MYMTPNKQHKYSSPMDMLLSFVKKVRVKRFAHFEVHINYFTLIGLIG